MTATYFEAIIAFSALAAGFALSMSQPDKRKKLMSIITPRWLIHAGVIILFSCVIILSNTQNSQLKTAVKRGILALIIAMFGEVGLTIAPFWTIFAVSYFMESWI